jgi:hypothetical protein
MSTAYDGQDRVRPSGRNGNRLPLRRPGERIGGRQKGTPNKMSPKLKRALIAVAIEIGRPKRVGKIWVPTGEGGLQGYFEWVALHYPKAFARLIARLMVLQEKSRERAHREG